MVDAIDAELKVQMGSCGPARGAYRTDVLALRNVLALFDIDAAQVGIHGGLVVPVFDHHYIAKTTLHTCKVHGAVTDATHWCAGSGCIVHAQMGSPRLQNGVEAHFEAAGNT